MSNEIMGTPMYIEQLQLSTHRLATLKHFYTVILGLPLIQESATMIELRAGRTRLIFTQVRDGSSPFYHFAFTIPDNKLALAKAWMRERKLLLSEGSLDEIDHGLWNAQSIYFYDPAGNIAECIVRHNLRNGREGPFSPKDILCVSEIGLVVDRGLDTVGALEIALDEQTYYHRNEEFSALGNDDGLLIIAKRERRWLMTDKPATGYPVHVTLKGKKNLHYEVAGYPYSIQAVTTAHSQDC
jgi:catechol 2,3-dioxygenase-like lactoylglutathione lyase family enzyme